MRDDYQIEGPKTKLHVEIEKEMVEVLGKMSEYTGHQVSELVNTAVKRFVASHKDFLPPQSR